jgi:hypothetical protein
MGQALAGAKGEKSGVQENVWAQREMARGGIGWSVWREK